MTALSAFLAFVGFAMLVILHELGHFWAAKSVGMRVEKFSLFFPPTLFSRKRGGETEYAIGPIPAGGYVKISGMNPSEDLPDEVRTRAYYAQPVWKRIVVIAAGPAMNLVLAFVLLFAFIFLIGGETQSSEVGVVEKDYPAATVLKPGDRLVEVDGKRGDPAALSKQVASHKCAGEANARLQGRRAGHRHRRAKRPGADVRGHSGLRPRRGADPDRLLLRRGAAGDPAFRRIGRRGRPTASGSSPRPLWSCPRA